VVDARAIFKVEAGIVAAEVAALDDVAATQDAMGPVEVDVPLNIRRQIVSKARGIVGDQEAHWDAHRGEAFGKCHGGIAAQGVTDNGNRFGVAAVIVNCLICDPSPYQVGVDGCRDPRAVNALRQFVHAPIKHADKASEEVSASAGLDRLGSAWRLEPRRGFASTDEAHRDQDSRDLLGLKHALRVFANEPETAGPIRIRRSVRDLSLFVTSGKTDKILIFHDPPASHAGNGG